MVISNLIEGVLSGECAGIKGWETRKGITMSRGASRWHWRQCYKEHKKALAFLRLINTMLPGMFIEELVEKLVELDRMGKIIGGMR